MKDLEFISGSFLKTPIPKDRQFLLHYFNTELQIAFVRYRLVYPSIVQFTNYTGYFCTKRLLYKLKARFKKLTELYDASKDLLTEEGMEIVYLLETGLLPLTDLHKTWHNALNAKEGEQCKKSTSENC